MFKLQGDKILSSMLGPVPEQVCTVSSCPFSGFIVVKIYIYNVYITLKQGKSML